MYICIKCISLTLKTESDMQCTYIVIFLQDEDIATKDAKQKKLQDTIDGQLKSFFALDSLSLLLGILSIR